MVPSADPSPIWHAMDDPTRRQILDLLRLEPRTTGELAAAFPSTRFAIMKHLTVLEEAGLVLVRRRGRERRNHLNALPFQLLYDRWVKPYDAVRAEKLTALKSQMEACPMQASMSVVEMEIAINAPLERVWKGLIEDTAQWWPRNFYTHAKAISFHIEPKLGGRMYENWGDGAGLIWGHVFGVNAPHSIHVQGCLAPPYGPGVSIMVFRLEERAGQTVLMLSDSTIGKTDACEKEAGWRELFEGSFKPFLAQ